MAVAEVNTYELETPKWDAVVLTGFSLSAIAQRELDNQAEIRGHFDFSEKALKSKIKKHGGLVFLQRLDLPVIACEENAFRKTEPYFFAWEYTGGPLNSDQPKLRTYLLSYTGATRMLGDRFGATKPKAFSWESSRLKTEVYSRFLFFPGPLDTSARKEGNERGNIAGEVHELKFNDFHLHSPLRMNEPVFFMTSIGIFSNVEVYSMPSFMSLVQRYTVENFRTTLSYAELVEDFSIRAAMDKSMMLCEGLLNRFREFIFNPNQVLRSELYQVFGPDSRINFGKIVDSPDYLIRVGLEGLIPNDKVKGGELIDRIFNKSVSLFTCVLKTPNLLEQADFHLDKYSLMTTVECLVDHAGRPLSNFDGKVTYSEHSHNLNKLLDDLYELTGETYSTDECTVPDLGDFRDLVQEVWKAVSSSSNLVSLTFDLKTIEEH